MKWGYIKCARGESGHTKHVIAAAVFLKWYLAYSGMTGSSCPSCFEKCMQEMYCYVAVMHGVIFKGGAMASIVSQTT